jgi:hypothetical protein
MVFATSVKKTHMAERRQDRPNDYSFVTDELRPLMDMYRLTIDNEKIVIPSNPDYGVLHNDGEIRFADITDITVDRAFIHILVQDGYLFSFYRREPLITCTRKISFVSNELIGCSE